ncbi:MAG: hypothetical protein RLZZ210_1012 [Pseudomonadota bacterium]|jgi:hypothetical protein
MKNKIILVALASMLSMSAFACQDERDHKAEMHKKMHEHTLASMSKEDKASYDKVSKIVDEFSESEKKALRVKLKDEYMMLSPEKKMQMHKEHKEHMKKMREEVKKEMPHPPKSGMTKQQEKDMKEDMKEPLKP